MIYKSFKDIQLSRLGLGNMRLPAVDPTNPKSPIDWPKAHEIMDYALEQGINYFDTAYVYNGGESERCVGAGLKRHDRDSFYVATKFNIRANPDYKAVFEEQLERLQMDRIDFYLIHCIMDNNVDAYLESGAIEYFLEQKKLGRIKYLGFSSHAGLEALEKFANHHDWDFAQLQINYFDWNYAKTKEEYKILEDRNIPIMVMEPVRGGKLAKLTPAAEAILKEAHPDWSIASWALRFVRTLSQTQVILSGMSAMDQIVDNVKTFSDPESLSEEDMATLMEACEVFHKSLVVPCTGCRYCCDDCPMQINIPEFLKVYNTYKTEGRGAIKSMVEAIQTEGTPADCVGCGSCTSHCPQNINIPDIMQELAEILAK